MVKFRNEQRKLIEANIILCSFVKNREAEKSLRLYFKFLHEKVERNETMEDYIFFFCFKMNDY